MEVEALVIDPSLDEFLFLEKLGFFTVYFFESRAPALPIIVFGII